jgi:hypothetical protein
MAHYDFIWNPHEPGDPGPCIDVIVMNSPELIRAGLEIGFEYPKPQKVRALIDTGAALSVISKKFADYCKLRQTGANTEIIGLGGTHRCDEHAGSISFPGTALQSIDTMRFISANFVKTRHHSCLIGRDILQNWRITFDGPGKRVVIED